MLLFNVNSAGWLMYCINGTLFDISKYVWFPVAVQGNVNAFGKQQRILNQIQFLDYFLYITRSFFFAGFANTNRNSTD